MDILIHTDGVKLSEELEDAVLEKIGRVEQYAPRALRARVRLRKTSAHASPRQYLVRVVCEVPGSQAAAEQRAADPVSALDVVAEKIERILRKRKTALLARRNRQAKIKPRAATTTRRKPAKKKAKRKPKA